MRVRFRPLAIVGFVALVGLVAASTSCAADTAAPPTAGPGTTGTPGGSAPAIVPLAPDTPTTTDPPGVHRFSTFWMRTCDTPEKAVEVTSCRLGVGEIRTTTEDDVVTAAMNALMAGPDPTETALGLSTNIRSIAIYEGLAVDADGTATVKFNRYFETAKTRPQTAQVVYTLTQFPEIKRVRFLIDGMANGAAGAGAMSRADIDEFTPPIFVESPALTAPVDHRFRATGTAATAIGSVAFHVEDASGASVAQGTAPVLGPSDSTRGPLLLPVTVPASVHGVVVLVVTASAGSAPDPAAEARIPLTLP